ncbi:YnbE family lipoprotein [Aliidiomarina halalkaliphila]
MRSTVLGVFGLSILALTTVGCTPTVRVATPEPITINLNVKIEHEIYIRVARELDEMFSESSGLF